MGILGLNFKQLSWNVSGLVVCVRLGVIDIRVRYNRNSNKLGTMNMVIKRFGIVVNTIHNDGHVSIAYNLWIMTQRT